MLSKSPKRILVAPLDWGIGHATRCVPIIQELVRQGAEVILAADGRPYDFLKKEFPELVLIRLIGYGITYPKHELLGLHLILKSSSILKKIKNEKILIEKIVLEHAIDIIISDNRFACRSNKTLNIYITHQLNIKAPFAENLINRIHKNYYEKFDEIWVPDTEKEMNLSGELGHVASTKKRHRYIGPLTRFTKTNDINSRDRKWWLIVLLSGPEPQRSIFEKIILTEVAKHTGEVLLLRGIPAGEQAVANPFPHVTVLNHLATEKLEEEILNSHFVVCRPGYSTLCDLAALNISPIVVPTPGQTEQQYLATYHAKQNNVVTISQKKFSLRDAINKYHQLKFFGIYPEPQVLGQRIREILRG